MKKFLLFFLMAVVFIFSAHAQQWVNFSSSVPKAPEINLLENARTVSFTVTFPGIYTLDTVVNGTAFKRLHLPGGGAINPAGEPELPLLAYKVAIPYCDEVEVAYQIRSRQTMPSCWVYPKPEMVFDGNGNLVEQFAFNPTAYTIPRANDPAAIISSSGALRAQRYVEVTVYPIEFCPVMRQLSVIDQIEITLTFTKPQGDLRQHLGIFNSVAATAFINYEDDGTTALVNDKAYTKAGFKRGNVEWFTITDTAQAATIPGDYLIITVPEFFDENNPNSQLQRLANHRAWYNGFDVSIVNVAGIFSDSVGFYFEGNLKPGEPFDKYKLEQRLRTFIRRVFEGKNAHHSQNPYGDGSLAYVLLVGDYQGSWGIPGAKEHGVYYGSQINDVFPSDYHYSCVTRDTTGGYDDEGDLFIGRFSVQDTTQLYNMVEKTISHETEYYEPEPWRQTMGNTIAEIMPSTYSAYINFINNLLIEKGWEQKVVNSHVTGGVIKDSTIKYLNEGASYAQYYGKSGSSNAFTPSDWYDNLTKDTFALRLQNDYQAPFITAIFCHSAHFDNHYCLAEFLTTYSPTKGAVGYIGASRANETTSGSFVDTLSLYFHECFPWFLFKKNISIAGELLLKSKLTTKAAWIKQLNRHLYNLFGDPAFNIIVEPTNECRMYVTSQEQYLSGQVKSIPDDCILYFEPQGKLIIEEGGALELGNRVQVIGLDNEIQDAIHIKGGGLTVGEDVVFQDLPGGVLLENAQSELNPSFFDENLAYNLKGITFNNTPIIHRGTPLIVSNCTFNEGSDIKTSAGWASIDSCIFNNATFMSDKAAPLKSIYGNNIIFSSTFTGNNSKTAIHYNNSEWFGIANNTISGYKTGIYINESGTTFAFNSENNINTSPKQVGRISVNNISNCGTGVTLYNSFANINGNNIFNSVFGVRLYNYSYTWFEDFCQSEQRIKNCDSIEIYASANSFPTYLHNNIIIDESNIGAPTDIPLLWWDATFVPKPVDITYNCWGKNFKETYHLYPTYAFIWSPDWKCEGKSGTPTRGDDEILYLAGLEFFSNEDYPTAEATFKEVIATYPDSRFAIAAMHELFALEHYTNQDFYSLNNYFATFTPADSNLYETADFLATRCHVKERNWQPAVDWYENRIENPPSYQDSIFAVIDLGALHLMIEQDTASGAKASYCSYRLAEVKPASKQAYETHKTALLATLPQIKKPQTDKPQNPLTPTHKKGALGECIPNPTNGNATIFYELYTEGIVDIQIYNSMGQLVKSISIGTSVEGNHQVKISLLGVPAGLYHYTLLVNGEKTDARKLVVN